MVKKLVSWDEALERLPPVVREKLDSLYASHAQLATKTSPDEVHALIAADLATWVGTAPEALDTLVELAAALGNNPNFATDVLNLIADMQTQVNNKADKVHTHTTAQISDATPIGVQLMRAANQAAGRSAIAAGTSNLAIGTATGTALEGHRLQVVGSVPGSPVANVWYGIPE